MAIVKETILLDKKNYNKFLKKWDVPFLLAKPCIVPLSIHVDDIEVPTKDYKIENNVISFHSDFSLNSGANVYLVVEININYEESNERQKGVLVSFWLPIVLAIISFFGAIAQPILYKVGLIYQKDVTHIREIACQYHPSENRTEFKIRVQSIRDDNGYLDRDSLKDWKLYIAVKEEDRAKDFEQQSYKFFSGPIDLKVQDTRIDVFTDSTFSKYMNKGKRLLTLIFLAKKDIKIQSPFVPSNYGGNNNIKFIGNSVYSSNEFYETK